MNKDLLTCDWIYGMTSCFLGKKKKSLHTFQGRLLQLISGVVKTDSPLGYLLILKFAFILFFYYFQWQYA